MGSGAFITCTGVTTSSASISNSPSANNVSVVLQQNASVTSNGGLSAAPKTFVVGNNASLTVNNGASLVSTGKGKNGTAFSAGTGLQALIMSGSTVTGNITAGAGSHITVAGTITPAFLASAILLTGDGNTLTLNPGYSLTSGGIMAAAQGGSFGATGTTLELGGSGAASFDVSQIGAPDRLYQFRAVPGIRRHWTLLNTPTQTATPWTITGGTLTISGDAQLDSANSTLTLSGGTLAVTASTTSARGIVVGGGTFDVAAGQTYTVSGVISGTGALNLTDSGTMLLTGINTYSGGTNITGGTLQLGTGGTLGTGALAISSGAALNLGGISSSVTGLSGAGSVALGTATLTDNQTGSATFSGVISGSGGLTKSGSGALTLSGANSYTGGTQLTAGTLIVSGTVGAVTAASGTTLTVSGTSGNIAASGGTLIVSGTAGNITASSAALIWLGMRLEAAQQSMKADPIPSLLQNIPGMDRNHEFDKRVQMRFPVGSDEKQLAWELWREGFQPVRDRNAATIHIANFLCVTDAGVHWTADAQGKLTSIGSNYNLGCP